MAEIWHVAMPPVHSMDPCPFILAFLGVYCISLLTYLPVDCDSTAILHYWPFYLPGPFICTPQSLLKPSVLHSCLSLCHPSSYFRIPSSNIPAHHSLFLPTFLLSPTSYSSLISHVLSVSI